MWATHWFWNPVALLKLGLVVQVLQKILLFRVKFSPPNSVHVFKTSNAAFHDFIIPFPNDLSWPSGTQSGAYEFKMKMYIPQNSGAYINLGGPWSGTSQFHHGMGIYFNADGTARSEFNETAQFTYPQNQWFDLSFIFDLTGTLVTSGQFHDTQLIINGVVKASEWVEVKYQ